MLPVPFSVVLTSNVSWNSLTSTDEYKNTFPESDIYRSVCTACIRMKYSCNACGDLKTSENFNVSLEACLQIVGTTLRVVCEVPRITENQVDG